MSVSDSARSIVRRITSLLPRWPGMGRCILAVDSVLHRADNQIPDDLVAELNGRCRLQVDGRVLEQKFAFYYGEWEREYLQAALRHYHQGVFYDIGGSIGLYATTIGLQCKARGRLLRTIEPLPENLTRLHANLRLNGLDATAVTVHGIGLSHQAGSFQVALVAQGVPGNAKVVHSGGVTVQVSTLDAFWSEHGREEVGFIKIDTEGYDALILQGGRDLICNWKPNLLVEFNRERMRNLNIEMAPAWNMLIKELGYRCYRISASGKERPVSDPGLLENLLFIAPGRQAQ